MQQIALRRAGLVIVALTMGASSAMADLKVIQSNAPGYKVDTVLPDDTVFKLESGQRVQVLILPANKTRVFEGKGSHSLPEARGGTRSATGKK